MHLEGTGLITRPLGTSDCNKVGGSQKSNHKDWSPLTTEEAHITIHILRKDDQVFRLEQPIDGLPVYLLARRGSRRVRVLVGEEQAIVHMIVGGTNGNRRGTQKTECRVKSFC